MGGVGERLFTPDALSRQIHDSRNSLRLPVHSAAESDQAVDHVATLASETTGATSASAVKSQVAQTVSNLSDEMQHLKFQFSEFRAELVNMRSALGELNVDKRSPMSPSVKDTAVSKLSDEMHNLKGQIVEFHVGLKRMQSAREELNLKQGLHTESSVTDSVVSKLADEMCELKAQFNKFRTKQMGQCSFDAGLTCSGGTAANNNSVSGSAESLGTANTAKQLQQQQRQQQQIVDVDGPLQKANSVLAELKDWMSTLNALHVELAKDNWSATTQSLKTASPSAPTSCEKQHQHSANQEQSGVLMGPSRWQRTNSGTSSTTPKQYDELLAACSTQARRIQRLESLVLEHGKQSAKGQHALAKLGKG